MAVAPLMTLYPYTTSSQVLLGVRRVVSKVLVSESAPLRGPSMPCPWGASALTGYAL